MTDYNRKRDRLDHGPAQPVQVEQPESTTKDQPRKDQRENAGEDEKPDSSTVSEQ